MICGTNPVERKGGLHMWIDPIPGRARNRTSVSAILALCFFLTSCGFRGGTSVPTTWTITVKTAPGKVKPDYEFTASPDAAHNGCSHATSASGVYPAVHLQVCPSDIIQWQGYSNGNQHEMVVFVSDKILHDHSGNAQATFPASNGNPTPPGNVSTDPSLQGVDHEWFVMLFDKQTGDVHYDDPKILIGR